MVAAGCVPEVAEETIKDYDPTTVMGEVQAAGVLVVGVPGTRPLFAPAGQGRGFLAALARDVAAALGVPVEFVVAGERRLLSLPERERVDMAFPPVPMTEKAVRAHAFTDPYLVTHQRTIVPVGTEPSGARRVCTIGNDAVVPIAELRPGVDEEVASLDRCAALLARRRVEAVAGLDVHLVAVLAALGRDARRYEIAGDQLSTAGVGAVVEGGAQGWADFVSAAVRKAVESGRWTRAYRDTIAPVAGEVAPLPELTAEEAAALFPSS